MERIAHRCRQSGTNINSMQFQTTLNSENDTVAFAKLLAEILPVNCVVALDGTLGAGKTRLVRAFAEACGIPAKDVTSPTFTLWQTYEGTRKIHHLDAYRIADEDEFDALGVEECFDDDSITFIEWANRVETCIPSQNRISIQIEVVSENSRAASIASDDDAMHSTIEKLQAKI